MSHRANLAVILGVLAATIAVSLSPSPGIIQDTASIGWQEALCH